MPTDIQTILSDAQLQKLRAGYSLAAMRNGATHALADARYPGARGLVDALYDRFYPDQEQELFFDATVYDQKRVVPLELNNATRELILVGILAAVGNTFQYVVHVYWCLMLGVTVDGIANTILLSANYTGAPTWANGVSTLEQLLTLLGRCADEGKTSSGEIMGALQLTFGTGNELITG